MAPKQPTALVIDLNAIQAYTPEQLNNINLWDGDAFFGRLLCLEPGQEVPLHSHEHKDECFDILQGEGVFWLDDRELIAGPGTHIYVPAGVIHGFRANQGVRWLMRETVSERVYARRALKLVWAAVGKRVRRGSIKSEA